MKLPFLLHVYPVGLRNLLSCVRILLMMDLVLAKVKAHQVRALAASQAFYNNAPIASVLEACTWACHNTFSSYYLSPILQATD